MQYPGYEIERFEDEGGSTCYYKRKITESNLKMEEIPVVDLEDDNDAGQEDEEHQES